MKKYLIKGILSIAVIAITIVSAKADVEAPGGGGIGGDCKPPTTNKCMVVKLPIGSKTIDGVLTIVLP